MELNERQLEAVKHGNYPLLILAGAGTGKTTTILDRIEYVVKNNSIDPETILALTFSVEATENIKKRLSNKDIPDSNLITVATFHSFAKGIIENNYLKLGYKSNPTIINKDDLVYLFLSRINTFNYFKSRRFNRFPVKAIKSLLSIHDQFCQELFNDKELIEIKEHCLDNILDSSNEDDESYRQIYDSVNSFDEFRRIKRESLFIEYEDIIYDFWKLINIDLELLHSLQNKYKFIIIDEFQDNNFAFSEIVNKIASHKNITVVGDDDQSIYSFRGANSYNMHSFHSLYSKNPNYKKIELIKNYRSNQKILDVANSVIVNNQNRMEKEFLVSAFDNSKDSLVELRIGDFQSQIASIVDSLKFFLNNNKNKDIAVLCRTHSDCAIISEVLNKNGILHNYSNDKLFEQKIIKDIVALLNIIVSSKYDLHSLIRLSRKYCSNNFIENIVDLDNNNNNLLKACINNKNLFTNIEYDWLEKIQRLTKKYSSKNRLVDELVGFFDKVNSLSNFEFEMVEAFRGIINKFDGFYSKNDIRNLCTYINLMLDNNNVIIKSDNIEPEPIVNLMTVHNSKGMEFDYVFLPFLQSSKFPQANKNPQFANSISIDLKKWNAVDLDQKTYHVNEERRLFYVAITRAKEKLYLFSTPKRQSKFIKEIDDSIYINNVIDIKPCVDSPDTAYTEKYNGNPNNDILYLSASKIENYNKCQLRYKYSSLDAIPGFKYNSVFVLGNIIHKVLQDFHESSLNTYDEMVGLLDKYWSEKLYSYSCESRQYYLDAKNMLVNYFAYLGKNSPSPILFEYFFKIKMKDYILSGVIDRVDIDSNGKITIYDYKTSKTQKTTNQIKKNLQLPIYALAIYSLGESMHESIANHSYPILAGELSVRFSDLERVVEFSKLEIQELESEIDRIAEQISSGSFKASPGFMNCTYCDYKKFICSYYN